MLSALQESLIGSYRCFPTTEDYHKAKITVGDDGELAWSNEAGQAWTVRLEESDKVLLLDESCPHYADGERSMTIDTEGSAVVGIVFRGDLYAPQEDGEGMVLLGMPSLEERLVGRYLKDPFGPSEPSVELKHDNGKLTWNGSDGAGWILNASDDGDKVMLTTGEDCPFYAQGGTSVTVKEDDGVILSIEFMGVTYTKSNEFGDDESEGAVADGEDFLDELSTDGI